MKRIEDIGKHLPKVPKVSYKYKFVVKTLGAEMNTYNFTIQFDTTESDDDLADKLYEAGCNDALVGVNCGNHYIDFDRKATSINEAIKSAIDDIMSSGLDIRITNVTTQDASEVSTNLNSKSLLDALTAKFKIIKCIVPACNVEATYCIPSNLCDKHWDEWWNWDETKSSEPDWMKNLRRDKKI